jgi:hypothetical protein
MYAQALQRCISCHQVNGFNTSNLVRRDEVRGQTPQTLGMFQRLREIATLRS